jgi:hypothetical protein
MVECWRIVHVIYFIDRNTQGLYFIWVSGRGTACIAIFIGFLLYIYMSEVSYMYYLSVFADNEDTKLHVARSSIALSTVVVEKSRSRVLTESDAGSTFLDAARWRCFRLFNSFHDLLRPPES